MIAAKRTLAGALVCLAALVSCADPVAPASGARRPNVIFLMDDQHRWDALGCIDPGVKTPTLDGLARAGILFDQAVCQAPMCVPSRHSLMLGLYPHQVGVLSNAPGLSDTQLPCDALPEVLRKAGYQTAGFGKTHWAAKSCSTRGFEVRYASTDPEQGAVLMSQDNPGGLERYHAETKDYGGGEEQPAGYLGCTSRVPEADHRDGWTFNRCLDFLDNGLDAQRPLFLYLSFLKPHAGHNVPPGYEGFYELGAMPVPEQPPVGLVEPCHATGLNREELYRSFWSRASREQWQQMVLRYRANCTWMDSLFGRVMDKLRAKGLLDNCLIVYASDHGEMLGERYYRFNKYCLFDASVRVPLIVAGTAVPVGRRGTLDHRPAELLDIFPTVLEAAGVRGVSGKPGLNLLGPAARAAGFCEFNDQPTKVSFMWRTADRKLILTFPRERVTAGIVRAEDVVAGEFYDLKRDSREWQNLYAQEEARTARDAMTGELIAHVNGVALKRARR